MKRGSKEAQRSQIIWLILAAIWIWPLDEPLGAAVAVTIALVFWFLEVVCRSIEWAAQERSRNNVEVRMQWWPQDKTHSGE